MRISEFLEQKAIELNLKSKSKGEVLEELVNLLSGTGKIEDKKELLRVIREREELGSTGIGYNIAIPHARCRGVKKLIGGFGISREGIDFDALDGEPVHLFFILGAPPDASGEYLKALACISRILRRRASRLALLQAKTSEEVESIFRQTED